MIDGKELFRILCKNIEAPIDEVGKVELTVYSDGQSHIVASTPFSNRRHPDWALWGNVGDDVRSVAGLEARG